ncbi:hypothetical protein DSM106972_025680 [Dulcicalothrix desertica PCC 7102]|uniref:Uncharacterized protein n=1 Tax=Dulcicalothrix desertica PCC 7102 TaxID=232991 RepID=A0A433VMK8_9CYAN|nr:hypothetical protein [Dulcicalothrix desertica]RUT07307.1 hypothetical protein DSM106972_025680 [Dulcicalothrix desertica PCC 7102]TWH55497.1 hypothetical protein CAL7102_03640 [Dulcicalothrix desertica PCC 7102]
MTQQANNQNKLENISAWVEHLHELESSASAGKIMTDEEYNFRLQSVIDGSCFQKYLNNILQQKEETLKKLAALEKTENYLRKTISEVQSFIKTQDS